jgi:hypothetical protein
LPGVSGNNLSVHRVHEYQTFEASNLSVHRVHEYQKFEASFFQPHLRAEYRIDPCRGHNPLLHCCHGDTVLTTLQEDYFEKAERSSCNHFFRKNIARIPCKESALLQ